MTNGKISLRQMKRLLFFDVIGIGLVALPDILASKAGTTGALALLVGAFCGIVYLWLLQRAMEGREKGRKLFYGIYGGYLLLAGGYGLFLLADLIQNFLLPEQSFALIVLLLLLLVVYEKNGGLEGRARVYEVLFWPLVILLIVLIGLGIRGIQPENLLPLKLGGRNWGVAVYVSFLLCSVSQVICFMPAYMEEGVDLRDLRKGASGTILWATIFLACIYEILLGSFGQRALSLARTPIMIYTSNVVVPGGFLRRQEALIAGICFVALLAFVGSGFSYGTLCLKSIKDTKWMTWLALILLFLIAMVAHYNSASKVGLGDVIVWTTPIALVLTLLLAGGAKSRNMVALGLAVCTTILFTGCSVKELENRSFPMVMSLSEKNGDCVLSYQYMDLSRVSEKEKTKQGSDELQVQGKDVSAAIYQMDTQSGKVLDLNHLKVLLLDERFLKNHKLMQSLMEKGNGGVELPGNMLVFVTKDYREIEALQEEMDEDLGSYLEELMEGNPNYKNVGGTSFKDLICDWYNANGNTVLPRLSVKENLPVVEDYDLLVSSDKAGKYQVMQIDEEDGLLANLCDGEADAVDVMVDDGRIHLENVKVSYEFSRSNRYVLCQVLVSGDIVVSDSIHGDKAAMRKAAEDFFLGRVTNAWNEQGVDLTNSYYHLRVHDKDLYEKYEGDFAKYRDDLQLQVTSDFRFVA